MRGGLVAVAPVCPAGARLDRCGVGAGVARDRTRHIDLNRGMLVFRARDDAVAAQSLPEGDGMSGIRHAPSSESPDDDERDSKAGVHAVLPVLGSARKSNTARLD